jgi:YHS domain-containing protein
MLLRFMVPAIVAVAVSGCESRSRSAPPSSPPAVAVSAPASVSAAAAPSADHRALTRVEDVSQVCMVNNQFMGKPQIPVEVGGKTYFGCCAMCKGRLESDASARAATDPITGESVDKASAVIAQDAQGAVVYFASAEHLARYQGAP